MYYASARLSSAPKVEIRAELKERRAAEADYAQARAEGRQGALVRREAPDVFSLQVTGLQPDQW